jgi:hypothetical protein
LLEINVLFSFLWTRKREIEGIPPVKWSKVAKPKEEGGGG